MLRRHNLLIAGILSAMLFTYAGLKCGDVLKDRSEGWISVQRMWLWTWCVPKAPSYALRIARIEQNILFWGPTDDVKTPEDLCSWGRQVLPKPRDSDEDGIDHFFMPLRNPGDFRSVAVIEVKSNKVIELNPRRTLHPGKPWQTTFDYGPIPNLSDLTALECEKLWGPSENIYPSVRTFKLKAFNDQEDNDFFLDLSFEYGYLQKYRVRTSATKGFGVWKVR